VPGDLAGVLGGALSVVMRAQLMHPNELIPIISSTMC
jgi:hypothetical protein